MGSMTRITRWPASAASNAANPWPVIDYRVRGEDDFNAVLSPSA